MALAENKKTGKAIADVKALYFLKHENDEEPVILENLDSSDWFPVLSLKGTVNASQDAPSIEKILVDQFDAPIGITTEPGDFNFEAQLPSLAKADIANWLEIGTGSGKLHETGASIDGREVIGFNLDGKTINVSVLIKTGTGACIIFSNAQVVLTFSKEDKVFLFRVSGQVLAPENENNDMIYLATEKMVAVTGVTISGEGVSEGALTLPKDDEVALVATIAPANASNKAVTWSSSDATKVAVDANGKVTGMATSGSATITATSVADNTKTASITVTCASASA